MRLQHTIKAVIRPGEQSGYVMECVEIPVVTQGATLDETVASLYEATELHLEGAVLAVFQPWTSFSGVSTVDITPRPAAAGLAGGLKSRAHQKSCENSRGVV